MILKKTINLLSFGQYNASNEMICNCKCNYVSPLLLVKEKGREKVTNFCHSVYVER